MFENEDKLSKKFVVSVLLILLICGIYLRFYNLGELSFWVDEMNHVFAGMSFSKGETPHFPSGVANERAQIYSHTVGWTFSLLGVNEFSARFSSALFGLLSILLIFLVGRSWFGTRVGLIAAFFLTFAHPAIGWSRTSRMYTLFQLLFLLGVFLYYKGFEAKTDKPHKIVGSEPLLNRAHKILYNAGLRWQWLLLCGAVFFISLKVHQLTGLFGATLIVFWLFAVAGMIFKEGLLAALRSKYAFALGITSVIVLLGLFFFDLFAFIKYAVDFHPNWAQYDKVQDPLYYYRYLTFNESLPLSLLFLLGAVYAFFRLNKAALFAVTAFSVPVLFQSLVFSYKIPNYIFNVYPFFIFVVAFGVGGLYQTLEAVSAGISAKLDKFGGRFNLKSRRAAIATVFAWGICSTLWFRIAVGIPNVKEAGSNGAIIHYDWRGAAEYVSEYSAVQDVVGSTLPLTVSYYLERIDYNLNKAHLDPGLRWETESTNGRHFEFYTGVPSIETVGELRQVMIENKRGWLILDRHRLSQAQYVNPDLAQFIENHLTKEWSDKRDVVRVYHWSS